MPTKGDQNRSVQYTKKRLKDALIQLMKQKPYSEIRVGELVREANVGRTTFYNHYLDITDLIEKIEADLVQRIDTHLKQIHTAAYIEGQHPYITEAFRVMYEEKEMISVLCGANGDIAFQRSLSEMLCKTGYDQWRSEAESEENFLFVASFIAGGMINMFLSRFADLTETDIDRMGYIAGEYLAFSKKLI